MKNINDKFRSEIAQLWDQLGTPIDRQANKHIHSQLFSQIGLQLWLQLWVQLKNSI